MCQVPYPVSFEVLLTMQFQDRNNHAIVLNCVFSTRIKSLFLQKQTNKQKKKQNTKLQRMYKDKTEFGDILHILYDESLFLSIFVNRIESSTWCLSHMCVSYTKL